MLTTEVARRLEQKLGLGQFPMVRRRLYARLQRLAITGGEGVLQVIAGVLDECQGPKVRDKGQYFCFVVKRRLEESGFSWDAGRADPAATPAGKTPVTVPQLAAKLQGATALPADPLTPKTVDQARADLERVLKERAWQEMKARLRSKAANAEGQP